MLLILADSARGRSKDAAAGHRRLDVLIEFARDNELAAFEHQLRDELARFGWNADKNLLLEWHYANDVPERLSVLAADIVRNKPDAILTYLAPATRALMRATSTIPIVTSVGNPIESGFASSYARPGRNVTGLSYGRIEAVNKAVELLRDALPMARHLVIAMKVSDESVAQRTAAPIITAGQTFGFTSELVLIKAANELRFQSMRSPSALIPLGFDAAGGTVAIGDLIAIALGQGVPALVEEALFVRLGGLLSFEPQWENQTQRMASQLDKVLRGGNPAEIPFELPTRFWLTINLRTAEKLGIVVPASLLVRADQVVR